MKTHVKALVVGGGAVGAGIAYHLAKAGWDTMLIERDELTSGSTWHAAGLLPLFNMSYATTHIHKYSVDLQIARGRDGSERGFLRRGQPSHGSDAGTHGRVHALFVRRRNRRCLP